jgi:inositol oxygenase
MTDLIEETTKNEYRQYLNDTAVSDFYKTNHIFQTMEHAEKIRKEVFPLGRWKLDIFEVISLLDDIVDDSDPDLQKKQIIHALQTGEACRKARPEDDWFHLVGFLHDLGKILSHPKMHNLPQWTVVGDTFPIGCAHSDKIVYPEYFQENSDFKNKLYNTNLGIYSEKVGFDSLTMSFGHDEYMYQVLVQNGSVLPEQALYIVRFHSFYPWHSENAYDHFASEKDRHFLSILREFQKCDLYSKSEVEIDVDELKPYYQDLINKYFPNKMLNW